MGGRSGPRWDEVLRESGLSDTELAQAKCSPAYTALLAQLRDAESRGFDIHTELLPLITGRSFDDADDVASALHHRVDRYVTEVGYPSPRPSELVAGIFPRPSGFTDPDIVTALNDRADVIEQRARELAVFAIERGDAWVKNFGDPPPTGELHEQWSQEVASGAAYIDHWRIDNPDTLLDDALICHEQEDQRSLVRSAAQRAGALAKGEEVIAIEPYVLSGCDLTEPPNPDFGPDL